MQQFRSILPPRTRLPERIVRLHELSYNLWWTWQPEAARLFGRLDYDLWERLGHNPIKFLRELDPRRLENAAAEGDYLAQYDFVLAAFDLSQQPLEGAAQVRYPELLNRPIAYFSMEYGLHETLPLYSGGLGVLAADHLKEASDLGLPLVGVGFLYTEGYFTQRLSEDGWQQEVNHPLRLDEIPALQPHTESGSRLTVEVELPGRAVTLQLWEVRVGRVPLYLLDSNVEENSDQDRLLTARLYWSDLNRRIMQEVLLGVGGVRALRALGYNPSVWHMNEGHAAFLIIERAREQVAAGKTYAQAIASTRRQNVFTTHTPVPAGNDEFPLWLIDQHLSALWPQLQLDRDEFVNAARHTSPWGEAFSMGVLALRNSDGRNAVSDLHGRVARKMWHTLWPERPEAEVPITHVTNGVHIANWLARRMSRLLSRHLGEDWYARLDEEALWTRMDSVPDDELWDVHLHLKRKLAFYLRERVRDRWTAGDLHPVQVVTSGVMINPYALTIGFARRFASYKRASLLLRDVERLLTLVNRPNMPVQIIFAGKSHPADQAGKELIQSLYRDVKRAESGGRIAFLEDYDINLARYLVQGVDVWLNTPRRPMEASGTSGMKAAINGVLNFSVLDGWWREAYDGQNGWAIGTEGNPEELESDDESDAESLYTTLEHQIIPLFYQRDQKEISHGWLSRMKRSMRTVIPNFSARRMVKEYVQRLYIPAAEAENGVAEARRLAGVPSALSGGARGK